MDVRLGVIDPGLNCKTCGSKLKECLGHFGFIELARPLIHIKFVSQIQALLAGTCRECGIPLMTQAKIEKELANINAQENCDDCIKMILVAYIAAHQNYYEKISGTNEEDFTFRMVDNTMPYVTQECGIPQ